VKVTTAESEIINMINIQESGAGVEILHGTTNSNKYGAKCFLLQSAQSTSLPTKCDV
jgi:hypothetical protein